MLYGRLLLSLLERSHLLALNGRYTGDLNGRFTCTRYNGRSCVDVGNVNKELLSDVTYFRLLDSTIFSDHNHKCVSIKCYLKNSFIEPVEMCNDSVINKNVQYYCRTIGLLILR